jgi:hypothetical protein
MIIPLNIQFNFTEALDYYNTLEKEYKHLKWSFKNDVDDAEYHKHNGVFGWGIQSNLDDINMPCPPYDIHKSRNTEYKNTELVFGFAEKLINFFPEVRQLGIAGHPAGVEIAQHIDNDDYFKIHIPLITNSNAHFMFEDTVYTMQAGFMYLVETKYMHGTINTGSTRVHMLFKCPRDRFEEVSLLTGSL